MTTAAQIRAARALIGKSIDELATSSGIGVSVISALEAGTSDTPPGALEKLRTALEGQGVIFVASGDQDLAAAASASAPAETATTACARTS